MKFMLTSKLATASKPANKFLPDPELWNSAHEEVKSEGSSSSRVSLEVEELIESCLDHFANEDAIVLAEAYHSQVQSERSLFILGQSLARSGKIEAVYYLLKKSAFHSAQCRYLFAKCAFSLNRLQESESQLRDEKIADKFALNPVFNNTLTLPFAHSLLAKILGETNRTEAAKTQLIRAIESNSMLWSSVKNFCENNVDEQFNIKEFFPKSSAKPMSLVKQKRLIDRKAERLLKSRKQDLSSENLKKTPLGVPAVHPLSATPPAPAANTSLANAAARKRAPVSFEIPPAPKKKSLSSHSSSTTTAAAGGTTQHIVPRYRRLATSHADVGAMETRRSLRLYSAQEDENFSKHSNPRGGAFGTKFSRMRTQGQVIPTNPCKIFFDDNGDILKQEVIKQVRKAAHPLSSVNTTNTTTVTIAVSQQRGDENDPDVNKEDKEEEPMDLENSENEPFQRDSAKTDCVQSEDEKKDSIFCSTMDWMTHLSEVQDHLSHFRCSEALNLLDSNMPMHFSQLAICLELRARIFFENGEYKRAVEVFEECRRLYPHRVEGMEIFSTALWQLQDLHRLSALSAELTKNFREEPETWCVAGNCFSLEKQHETAVECLERAIRLNCRFGYAYSLLGHELITLNDLNRASQAFMQGIVCSPNDYRAWYGLGLVHYKEEQLSLARIHLAKAVQINSRNVIVLCQLAVVEQAQGRTKEAMDYLEKALGFAPNNVACRYHKARLLFDTGNYSQSLEQLMELKALSPDEAHVFYLLGRVHRKLGNSHLALLSYSWATEMDPRGEQGTSVLSDQGPYDDDPIDFNETRNSNNSF